MNNARARARETDPVQYTPELGKRLCELIASGMNYKRACIEIGSNPVTVWRWRRRYADFSVMLADAMAASADCFFSTALEIADTERDPQRGRMRSDAYFRAAKAMNPRQYGERVDLNVTQTIDLGAALLEARKRASLRPPSDLARIVDAEVIDSKALDAPAPTDAASVPDDDLARILE